MVLPVRIIMSPNSSSKCLAGMSDPCATLRTTALLAVRRDLRSARPPRMRLSLLSSLGRARAMCRQREHLLPVHLRRHHGRPGEEDQPDGQSYDGYLDVEHHDPLKRGDSHPAADVALRHVTHAAQPWRPPFRAWAPDELVVDIVQPGECQQ